MIVALSIEGGIVQGVSPIEDGDYRIRSVVIIDYDVDGMDIDDITIVPQGGGDTTEAYVYELEPEDWVKTGEGSIGQWLQEEYAPRIRHVIGNSST